MKIVHLTTFVNGGAGKAAFRLHLSLLNQGIDSNFLSLYDFPKGIEDFKEINFQRAIDFKPNLWVKFKNKIIQIQKAPYKRRKKKLISELMELKKSINVEAISTPFSNYIIENHPLIQDADVIHLHWVSQMVDFTTFFKNVKKPIIWTLHDMNPFQGLFHYKDDYNNFTNLPNLQLIDDKFLEIKINGLERTKKNKIKIISPSEWLKNEAKASRLFSKFEIEKIPYGINLNLFSPIEKQKARDLLKLPFSETIILFIADSIKNKRKGIDLLLDAIKKFETNKLPIIIAIGDCEESLQLPENCIKTGRIDSEELLVNYYSASDLTVIPSREDNLPNVLLESIACGIPIVGLPVGGIKEHLLEFKTGLNSAEISSDELFNAINNILHKLDFYSKDEIRKYAFENFNSIENSKKYINEYEKIVNRN